VRGAGLGRTRAARLIRVFDLKSVGETVDLLAVPDPIEGVSMRKRTLAVVLGLLVFSLIAASAATLGGVRSDQLGADVGVVASCDTDGVDVAFTTSYIGGEYLVTSVELTDVSEDCDGQDVSVQLTSDGGTLGSGAGVADDSGSLSVTVDPSSAEDVTGLAVVISG
jgi:hypothetical protein